MPRTPLTSIISQPPTPRIWNDRIVVMTPSAKMTRQQDCQRNDAAERIEP